MNLKDSIQKMQGGKIAVIGDLMLDCYIKGCVNRISPEAPIPVLEESEETACLGGAANVMRNIVTMGGSVYAFGVTGADSVGAKLRDGLKKYGISAEGVLEDSSRFTTQKTRVVAGGQQLLRIDREDVKPISAELQEKIFSAVQPLIANHEIQAVVFEDYAKGVLTQELTERIVRFAQANGIITMLDPNPRNPLRIKGLTFLKPNKKEAIRLAGIQGSLDEIAKAVMTQWQPENLVISLSQDGMKLFRSNGSSVHISTAAREVYDVSGAGDTVLAASALAMASGLDVETALRIGNIAAGIAVGKLGTATVSTPELLANTDSL